MESACRGGKEIGRMVVNFGMVWSVIIAFKEEAKKWIGAEIISLSARRLSWVRSIYASIQVCIFFQKKPMIFLCVCLTITGIET
jgi:hypothetical protein